MQILILILGILRIVSFIVGGCYYCYPPLRKFKDYKKKNDGYKAKQKQVKKVREKLEKLKKYEKIDSNRSDYDKLKLGGESDFDYDKNISKIPKVKMTKATIGEDVFLGNRGSMLTKASDRNIGLGNADGDNTIGLSDNKDSSSKLPRKLLAARLSAKPSKISLSKKNLEINLKNRSSISQKKKTGDKDDIIMKKMSGLPSRFSTQNSNLKDQNNGDKKQD